MIRTILIRIGVFLIKKIWLNRAIHLDNMKNVSPHNVFEFIYLTANSTHTYTSTYAP